MKAVQIEVVSAMENEFKDLTGEVVGGMHDECGGCVPVPGKENEKSTEGEGGFCFIICGEQSYLFHGSNMIKDDASEAIGNQPHCGHKVIFDKVQSPKALCHQCQSRTCADSYCLSQRSWQW